MLIMCLLFIAAMCWTYALGTWVMLAVAQLCGAYTPTGLLAQYNWLNDNTPTSMGYLPRASVGLAHSPTMCLPSSCAIPALKDY